jgi:transposase-like protein
MSKDAAKTPLPSRTERREFLEQHLRARTREWIEMMVNEELDAALGLGRYERGAERRGYRKGKRRRSFTSGTGRHELQMPRGEYFDPGPDGTKQWRSRLIPRYARRTAEVEDALVQSYLSGTNTRRIKRALSPLLTGAALSKSTISRIVARLSAEYDHWRQRDLSGEDIAILFLDGFHLRIRLGGKVEKIPVLGALGVRLDGRRVMLALEVRTSESATAWETVSEDLSRRGVTAPVLVVIDGNPGLHQAVKTTWPWVDVQRCTRHKLENLYTHAPKRHYDEIKEDYHTIIYADSEALARRAYRRFENKWQRDCPAVVKSLREGGDELLTFFAYPQRMWKMLRTTNGLERINGEFRRRVKTQGSLSNSNAALQLLYGLFAGGMIVLRRIDGWQEMARITQAKRIKHGLIKPLDHAA